MVGENLIAVISWHEGPLQINKLNRLPVHLYLWPKKMAVRVRDQDYGTCCE